MIELYDFQAKAIADLRENIRAGHWTQLLALPTGGGKTAVASHLIEECARKRHRALFVADRISLIDQASAVLDSFGIAHGVVQANHWRSRIWEPVQVASAQTLARRGWPGADLIIVDEAHTVHANVAERIAQRDTVVIGLTATPFTKGLGRLYDRVVCATTTNALIEQKRLSPYRIFSASEPDMTGAAVVAGEWTDRASAERAMPIVGDIVSEYLKHCAGQKFIAFGVNVSHCEEIQRQLMAAGVQAGLYTYRTSDEERAIMLRDFKQPDGYLSGLISVAALAKGFDAPTVECIIMARPLRSSLSEHIQIFGRGLRADPANPEKVCTILDHAGNCVRMWAPTMEFFENGVDSLDDGKRAERKKAEARDREPLKCPECAHVHAPRPSCPSCGYEYPRTSRVTHVAGELAELAATRDVGAVDRRDLWAQLLWIARERGYATGWASHKYRARTGAWPTGTPPEPRQPTPALMRWVRSEMIRYAKRRAA
jgi:DNA repair protein RadD